MYIGSTLVIFNDSQVDHTALTTASITVNTKYS